MSNEKRAPGCLGYIGDEILPSYMGVSKNRGFGPPNHPFVHRGFHHYFHHPIFGNSHMIIYKPWIWPPHRIPVVNEGLFRNPLLNI